MRTSTLILFLTCAFHFAWAQRFVDNSLTLGLSYGMNKTIGEALTRNESYSTPSLLNNFHSNTAMGISVTYKVKRSLLADLEISMSKFYDWKYSEQNRFDNAQLTIISLNPRIGIVTPFSENGVLNRLSLLFLAGPSISINSVELDKAVFFPVNGGSYDFKKSTTVSPGVAVTLRLNVNLTNNFLLGTSYAVSHYWVSSVLYDDRLFNFSSMNFHLGLRLAKNKRYKYAP